MVKKIDEAIIKKGFETVLIGLGVDLKDENFKETPERVARSYAEMFANQHLTVDEIAKPLMKVTFPTDYAGIIGEYKIRAISGCPHHFQPIEYKVDVGYMGEKTIGLSKLPRLIVDLGKRAILQETYTNDIADAIDQHLGASGVMVIVHGRHGCMCFRGINQSDVITVTSSVRGTFETDIGVRQEFLSLISNGNK